MKYNEFHLGCEFKTGSEKIFRCTDIGQRVIVAICLDDYPNDTSWYNGPPYAVVEHVFDEYSQEDCTLSKKFIQDKNLLQSMTGKSDSSTSTDEIMQLTRGE